MTQPESVHVVGLGGCTAVGTSIVQSAAAVRAGIARFTEHPYLLDRSGEPVTVAMATYLPRGLTWANRLGALLEGACREALVSVSTAKASTEIPIILGAPADRWAGGDRSCEDVVDRIVQAGLVGVTRDGAEVIAGGHAAGILALATGYRRVARREADLVLVAGGESWLSRETIGRLDSCGLLKSRVNRYGFVPGEAAGACLLASASAVRRRSLPDLGRIVAVGSAMESGLGGAQHVNVGLGLTAAIRSALAGLPQGQRVDAVWCDLNGQRDRAAEYGFTVSRLSDLFTTPGDFTAPAVRWGDVGAASGPLYVALALTAARRGYARGPASLVWTSSMGGERAALLLKATSAHGGVEAW